jgi:hypothetical protein
LPSFEKSSCGKKAHAYLEPVYLSSKEENWYCVGRETGIM